MPPILPVDLELAKRYLASLAEAIFPVATDEAWNPRIVICGCAIVVEIVEEREESAADAWTTQLDDGPFHPVGCADPGLSGHQFVIDPPLDAVSRTVVADFVEMPIARPCRHGLAQDRIRRIGTELLARTGQPFIKRPDPVVRHEEIEDHAGLGIDHHQRAVGETGIAGLETERIVLGSEGAHGHLHAHDEAAALI